MGTSLPKLFQVDFAKLVELGHQVAAIIWNDYVERIELRYQYLADTAQQVLNAGPVEG
jgi:hypothetical protein